MHKNSFLFTQEPHWKKHHSGLKNTLPTNVQSWVYETHSLTKRLRKTYGQSVSVEILFHRKKVAFLSECRLLKLPHHQYNLIREVLLHANGKPLILARTILPEKTVKIAKRNLSHLGTRPLGEVIFSYPKLQRLDLNISCIKPYQWTDGLNHTIDIKQAIWGRRTVYAIHQQPLLVSEFFMPSALELG
ncbi:MAG: chorismate lyase [Methylococcales symbiont of Hymedesmia sp. n. MRB-2018]|nr:MAG: chorismate lyase [Methylococcales symbiont of Hymedesmia sp. n. MRB-2018]